MAEIEPADVVVEVGPGLGVADPGAARYRRPGRGRRDRPGAGRRPAATPSAHARTAAGSTVSPSCSGDALRLDRAAPSPQTFVANLPYNVAVPVLLHLLGDALHRCDHGLVMVQLEVAERLAARRAVAPTAFPAPRQPGTPTSRTQGRVPRTVFWPVTQRRLRVGRLSSSTTTPTTASREEVFACIDAAFAQRRKSLRSAWRAGRVDLSLAETFLRAGRSRPVAAR